MEPAFVPSMLIYPPPGVGSTNAYNNANNNVNTYFNESSSSDDSAYIAYAPWTVQPSLYYVPYNYDPSPSSLDEEYCQLSTIDEGASTYGEEALSSKIAGFSTSSSMTNSHATSTSSMVEIPSSSSDEARYISYSDQWYQPLGFKGYSDNIVFPPFNESSVALGVYQPQYENEPPSGLEEYEETQSEETSDETSAAVVDKRPYTNKPTKIMLRRADGTPCIELIKPKDVDKCVEQLIECRNIYGFTQADIGALMGYRYGSALSQTTVSRFEKKVLPDDNMRNLATGFNFLIRNMNAELKKGTSPDELQKACKNGTKWPSELRNPNSQRPKVVRAVRQRRKRTSFNEMQIQTLELFFKNDQHPNDDDMNDIATSLGTDYQAVKNWFANKRQKMKGRF